VEAEPEMGTSIGVDVIFVFDDYQIIEINPTGFAEDNHHPMFDVAAAENSYLLGFIEIICFHTDHSDIVFVSAVLSHIKYCIILRTARQGFFASAGGNIVEICGGLCYNTVMDKVKRNYDPTRRVAATSFSLVHTLLSAFYVHENQELLDEKK